MRNSVDITRGYQIRFMVVRHFFALFVCALTQFICCLNFFDVAPIRIIIGVVFLFVYACMIYAGAMKLAMFDKKSYTNLRTDIRWSILWGAVIGVINLVMFFVFNHMSFWGENMELTTSNVVLKSLFFVLYSPTFAFLFGKVTIPVYTAVIMAILPVLSSVLGYFVGMNDFHIMDKIHGLMFEKDKDEK